MPFFQIRVTTEQQSSLREAAKRRGITTTSYVRSLVPELSGPSSRSPRRSAPPEEAKSSDSPSDLPVMSQTDPSDQWLAQRIRVLRPQHGPKAEAVARKEWAAL